MRDRLLAAVQQRLRRIGETGDVRLACEPEAASEASELSRYAQPADPVACHAVGWLLWYQYLASPGPAHHGLLRASAEMFVPCFLAGAGPLPERLLPVIAGLAAYPAGELLRDAARSGDLQMIEAVIGLWRRLVATAPDEDRASALYTLSAAMLARLQRTQRDIDLDEVIATVREAVAAAPGGADRATYLKGLLTALRVRFDRAGTPADEDEIVAVARELAALTPAGAPGRAKHLSLLAGTLRDRFGRTRAVADLDEAIDLFREATSAAEAGERGSLLFSLGATYLARANATGSVADVDESIGAVRRALDASPGDLNYRASLVMALVSRFVLTAAVASLDDAVREGRAALERDGAADEIGQARVLYALAAALVARSQHLGSTADLTEAISCLRSAVDVTPDDAETVYTLGAALDMRFKRLSTTADLDRAVDVLRAAVNAQPDTVRYLAGLAHVLLDKFRHGKTTGDLDEAITLFRRQAELADSEKEAAQAKLQLGIALDTRFTHARVAADLDDAISVTRAAVEATGHYVYSAAHPSFLADLLTSRYREVGYPADLDDALALYTRVAGLPAAKPSDRIRAAKSAADLLAGEKHNYAAAARLLAAAVPLLPILCPRQLAAADQQHGLRIGTGMADDAAALLLEATEVSGGPRPAAKEALRLLEMGRSVLLSQGLDARSDLGVLKRRQPRLADRFAELRDALDDPADNASAPDLIRLGAAPGIDRTRLAAEFDQVVEQIRAEDGFGSFLRPPDVSDLVELAGSGPIVLANISHYGSHAILLTGGGITVVPLPGCRRAMVEEKIGDMFTALTALIFPQASARSRIGAQYAIHEILEWLWDAFAGPVLSALGYTTTPAEGTPWPRLWLVPSGLLGLLPVHAAGRHRAAGGATVMDRVVTSYSPTVRALRAARERSRPVRGRRACRSLIVGMPTTPGWPPLKNVIGEVERLAARLPRAVTIVEGHHPVPTRSRVAAALSECDIAHLACHGTVDPADPSLSKLLLHDHETDPLTVASLASVDVRRAGLVFLSACTTAINPRADVADEAIHMAAAFLLAGFPSVIGTLWTINDKIAVEVADRFYGQLGGDIPRAAVALHHTIRSMRDQYPGVPGLWAPYIHLGV